MINTRDLTVVIHGVIPARGTIEHAEFLLAMASTRAALPEATIIISSWVGARTEAEWPVDEVVLSQDPGALPSFKKNTPHILNNVNRQLVSTSAGLGQVRTRYAIKLRNDFFLHSADFLRIYEKFGRTVDGNERILAPSLFTVDPRMFEQMPFHLSDWFQFGSTEKLMAMWSAPLMTHEDATYYDTHLAAQHSTYFDERYRSRLAIEQHTAVHLASQLGYETPAFHNDVRDEVLEAHDRFVAREWIIANPGQIGLVYPKYHWASRSSFQRLNCITFLDWLGLQTPSGARSAYEAALSDRIILKQRATRAHKLLKGAAPALNVPGVKRLLRPLTRTWTGAASGKNVF